MGSPAAAEPPHRPTTGALSDWCYIHSAPAPQVYVICESGGSLVSRPGVPTGFQSRSLKAVYFLKNAGYKNVKHIKGGYFEWNKRELPLVFPGEEEE